MQSGHCGTPLCIKGGLGHNGEGQVGQARERESNKVEIAIEKAKLGEVETYMIYIFKVLR
jgi:hypothetical protein